ncbi:MAG: MFS transporter [Anaerolineae bacterium]|nr:MFS transporter [Anaerolineae bacterium]
MASQSRGRSGARTFLIIWFGQLISLIGSGLTSFALGVYIYNRTGAATQLALSLVAASLPNLLLLPFAGALVDRWDRRRVLILSDTGAALVTLTFWALLTAGRLEVWHVYAGNALASALGAFQRPAYMAVPSLLVPKKQFGRIGGLMQLADAVSTIVAPLAAGFLIAAIDIQGVFLVDFATFLFAVSTLLVVRIPRLIPQPGATGGGSLLRQAAFGWGYLSARRGLLGMLILFAVVNFALGLYSALFTPLVLSRFGAQVLGSLLSISGLAMLAGSLVISAWGGTQRKIFTLLGAISLSGLGMGAVGLRPNALLMGTGNLFFFALVPIANAASQAIWLAKVAPDVQGRVFAARMMIGSAITPLAYLLAGPLADRVAEPLMAEGGALAATAGRVLGVGPGRGFGLIIVLTGLVVALAPLLAAFIRPIRRVEIELPDAVLGSAAGAPGKPPAAGTGSG